MRGEPKGTGTRWPISRQSDAPWKWARPGTGVARSPGGRLRRAAGAILAGTALLLQTACADMLLPANGRAPQVSAPATYAPVGKLACESDSTDPGVLDAQLLSGAGQFPTALPLGDGRTLVAFRGLGGHVSLAGRIDFGVFDQAWNLSARLSPGTLDSPLDDRGPEMLVMGPTDWLLLYSELNPGGPGGSYDVNAATFRIRFSRTTDGGLTWTPPVTPWLAGIDTLLAVPYGKMIQLADGRILASFYAGEGSAANWPAWHPVIIASRDTGATWSVISALEPSHSETALLSVGGDTLVAAMRSGGSQIDLTVSADLGGHWTPSLTVTAYNQVPADLAKLPNGELVLLYGSRADSAKGIYYRRLRRAGMRLAVSRSARVVPISASGMDLGYPSVAAVLAGGRVAAVYYVSGPDVTNTTQLHLVTFCPAAMTS